VSHDPYRSSTQEYFLLSMLNTFVPLDIFVETMTYFSVIFDLIGKNTETEILEIEIFCNIIN